MKNTNITPVKATQSSVLLTNPHPAPQFTWTKLTVSLRRVLSAHDSTALPASHKPSSKLPYSHRFTHTSSGFHKVPRSSIQHLAQTFARHCCLKKFSSALSMWRWALQGRPACVSHLAHADVSSLEWMLFFSPPALWTHPHKRTAYSPPSQSHVSP